MTLLLVSPQGDFPLNDDWIYAKSVLTLLSEHRYARHPFGQPTAVSHVLWGTLFAQVFGFSFTTLRLATLALALVGSWGAARCGRVCGLPRWAALLCGCVLLCNPLFVNLMYTFMTEVPYCASLAIAALFYLRALKHGRPRDALLGSIMGVIAFFVRQFAVTCGAAFVVAACMRTPRWKLVRRPAFCAAFFFPWLIGAGLFWRWQAVQESPLDWRLHLSAHSWAVRAVFAGTYVTAAGTLIGLFLLPITVARVGQWIARNERWNAAHWAGVALFLTAALVTFLAVHQRPLPLPGGSNILYDLGTGPMTLRDSLFVSNLRKPVHVGQWWWPITFLAVLSGSILMGDIVCCGLTVLSRRRPQAPSDDRPTDSGQALFLIAWAILLVASSYSPFISYPYDRYTLPVLLPMAILSASRLREFGKRPKIMAAISCAGLYLFSVACVQDYLAWNRARWAAIEYFKKDLGVAPAQIDGGYEFNGMYTSDMYMAQHGTRDFRDQGDKLYWVLDDTYAVARVRRPGYTEMKRFPYFSWLGMRERRLLALKRTPQGK